MPVPSQPDWNSLYALAEGQDGQFTTAQAADAGYSPQLLNRYLKSGRVVRTTRGVYRLVHFPAAEHEDLVTIWLWSQQQGVFSHETALMLHTLSDALPSTIHLTLPSAWRHRRLRTPHPRLVLHYADVEQRAWSGSIPITTAARTVNDCAKAATAPDLLKQACREGLQRGLFRVDDIVEATNYVGVFERRSTT
jgi:predicted transcriptional regulator of viral defense system